MRRGRNTDLTILRLTSPERADGDCATDPQSRAARRGAYNRPMPHAEPLTDADLDAALADLPEWKREGALIRRSVRVAGFSAAADLVRTVATAADAANHHPDVHITGYRTVTFELATHAAGAITRRDIELASEIDRLIDAP
jgi:4a-hydroxytetrahydrobiopterin dehydratase